MSWRPASGIYLDDSYRLVYPDGKFSAAISVVIAAVISVLSVQQYS